MAERSPGCSDEALLALCARKKRLQRNLTKGYYEVGDIKENIGMFSKLWNDRNSFIDLPLLKEKLGPCLINCHVHAMTGNCYTSLRVLASSLRVVSAMTRNLP